MFTTALFDLDGTLIDSIGLILDSYHHTLAVHGLPARDDAHWLAGIGTPLASQFASVTEDPVALERLTATYREYNFANHDLRVRPYPGVVDVLAEIVANGVAIGVVTSKSRRGAKRGLEVTGLADFVDAIVAVDDVSRAKPDPEPVHAALRDLDRKVPETVFIGDSVHDMRAGRAAGVRTGAALWGPFDRAALYATEPDFWFDGPRDVLTLWAG